MNVGKEEVKGVLAHYYRYGVNDDARDTALGTVSL